MPDLKEKCKKIRFDILNASFLAGACHIGSALSCVEILVDLFYNRMRDIDVFVFSKGSGSATLYCILADKGKFTEKETVYYLKNYPESSKEVPGVVHSVGSVGHGFAVAAGLAYAQPDRNVYCLLSDGELQEGSTYETALFARQHKLTNLFVIVDDNDYQACGKTSDIMDLETAFIFLGITIPNFERVRTIKGKGVKEFENDYTWHYRNLTPEILEKSLCQI